MTCTSEAALLWALRRGTFQDIQHLCAMDFQVIAPLPSPPHARTLATLFTPAPTAVRPPLLSHIGCCVHPSAHVARVTPGCLHPSAYASPLGACAPPLNPLPFRAQHSMIESLSSVEVLSQLERAQLQTLADAAEVVDVARGTRVITQVRPPSFPPLTPHGSCGHPLTPASLLWVMHPVNANPGRPLTPTSRPLLGGVPPFPVCSG